MPTDFTGLVDVAPSAANLVYKYFIEDYPELKKYEGLVHETDLVDSADLTLEQVANPQGTILLGLLLDPRTGLGLQRDMNISNFQWVSSVPELLTKHSVEEILAMQDTAERIDRYNDMHNIASEFYSANSRMEGNVIMTDVRGMDVPPANRFLIYTLPELSDGNISVRIADGKKGEFNTISVAHSIFNRTSSVDSGELCKSHGGGGHKGAATCQPNLEESKGVFQGIIEACKE